MRRLRAEEGQALVELALVIPLLIFILFAIVDFGEAINQYNDATNLANLGARAAAVASATNTDPAGCGTSTSLVSYIQCEGARDNAALANATVCASGTFTTGGTITVSVSSQFNWLHVLESGVGDVGGLSLNSTISSQAVMRDEQANSGNPWIDSSPGCP
jgi:Flp pilus assembly protein TadG